MASSSQRSVMLEYGISLLGIPYQWWEGGDFRLDGPPFWSGGIGEVPRQKITSCNCTGFLNLIRRKFDLDIPGIGGDYPGGTYEWFHYLIQKENLEEFDSSKSYPPGSLLFRPYQSIDDQGHVAIVYENSQLLHCYSERGVALDSDIQTSHSWSEEGYYKYVFTPESWMT